MDGPATLLMYSDLHCPYAYLAAWRLREVLPEFEGRVEVVHKSLAIEWVDRKVTPKDILDAETPLVMLEAPEAPYEPWHAPDWTWPVTMWPAFEAVKCAQRQGWRAAHALDWRLREAFWARSRCIGARHVVLEEARGVEGLDVARLERDWDAGVAKALVAEEAREGWETLGMEVSPTFVLPDGTQLANPAAPKVHLDEARHMRVTRVERPAQEDWRAAYRDMLARCVDLTRR